MIIYFEDHAKRMSELANCSYEEALEFAETQDRYFDVIGLNVYPEDEDYDYPEEYQDVVYDTEMAKYILNNSSLPESLIWELIEADLMYLIEVGLAKEEGIA